MTRHCAMIGAAVLLCTILSPLSTGSARAAAAVSEARDLYLVNCASCHGERMEGTQFGPAVSGQAFARKWAGRPDLLHKQIRATMPPAKPGSLDPFTYAAVSAHVAAGSGVVLAAVAAGDPAPGAGKPGVEAAPREVNLPSLPNTDATYQASERARLARLEALPPVTERKLLAPAANNWLTWRGSVSRQSFSTLDQINRSNVQNLVTAWALSLPPGLNQIEPLVHEGVMFLQSAAEILALDATNGTLLWRHKQEVETKFRGDLHRSIALSGTRVFAATSDGRVAALDMKSGRLLWSSEVVPGARALTTSGPMVVADVVIQGTASGPDCSASCAIVGFDVATGKELWRFKTTAGFNDANGDSWNGVPEHQRTGAAVWISGSYDERTGLVYFGTGQSYFVSPLLQPPAGKGAKNDALYTNSTVALDPRTGRLAWHHQHLARDIWDYDEAYERTMVTLPIGDRNRDALVTVGKLAIVDALDRHSGKHLFTIDLGLQNLLEPIDPATGRRRVKAELAHPESGVTYSICPSAFGSRLWYATAYDPARSLLFIPLHENCGEYTWTRSEKFVPTDYRISRKPRMDGDGNFGRVVAVDLKARKVVWTNRERPAPAGSLLATAGGIVFNGNSRRTFRALDSETGKTLWSSSLNAPPGSSPITYGHEGEQYVAVVAGVDLVQSMLGGLTPEIDLSSTSTTLWVFKLPAR